MQNWLEATEHKALKNETLFAVNPVHSLKLAVVNIRKIIRFFVELNFPLALRAFFKILIK